MFSPAAVNFSQSGNNIKTPQWIVLPLLLIISLGSGCIISPASPCGNAALGSDFVLVSQLPQLLQLQLQRQSKWSASLTDSLNSLLILTNPEPCVILNGKRIGNSADVAVCEDQLMVRRALAMDIGKKLRNHQPIAYVPANPQPKADNNRKINATVVIDAGHGGKDPGALNPDGHPEKILALDIARRVSRELKKESIKVILTRGDDTFVELNERAAIANRKKADLFVSIHLDINNSSNISGHTIYIARQPSSKAIDLGECIDNRLKKLTPGRRGLRNQDFRVLVRTEMPAVLVETGFLSNPADRAKLNTAGHRQAVAKLIAAGIIDYLTKK